MTRQKKEIIRKIEEIDRWIEVDMELGCGFAPPDAYGKAEEEIYKLQEELARLSHYDSAEDMFLDERRENLVYTGGANEALEMEQKM